MILIGTSGFSYQDWKGFFYPENLPAQEMLAYYAQHFSACEINSTYYRILSPAQSEAMVRKTQQRLTFVVKLHQLMTHRRAALERDFEAFIRSIQPFYQAGVLGGLLAQFPFSFYNNAEHRDYLLALKKKIPLETAFLVEFRHRSWNKPEIADFLTENVLNYVNVDEPALRELLPPTEIVTGLTGYIRFHGRNREKWFKKDAQPWERYDYLYPEAELKEWVPRIRTLAQKTQQTFVFFNNHWQSQAVTNAKQMAALITAEAN